MCSSCHPMIGTGEYRGVCTDTCNNLFKECRSEFYSVRGVGSERLTPCLDGSLICSRLDTIVSNGAELCARAGYVAVNNVDSDGDESIEYDSGDRKNTRCFDHTAAVPAAEGAAEKEAFDVDEMMRDIRRRRSQSGGRGDGFNFLGMGWTGLLVCGVTAVVGAVGTCFFQCGRPERRRKQPRRGDDDFR